MAYNDKKKLDIASHWTYICRPSATVSHCTAFMSQQTFKCPLNYQKPYFSPATPALRILKSINYFPVSRNLGT